jgi:hypothetical protein
MTAYYIMNIIMGNRYTYADLAKDLVATIVITCGLINIYFVLTA